MSPSALFFVAASAVGWALYDLARRSLSSGLGAWVLVVALTTGAVPLLLAWALWMGEWAVAPQYWAPGLASVALNIVANFAYFRAFQLAPLSVTLPMLSFTPLFASLLGGALAGEQLGLAGAFGAILVVAGGLALGLRSDAMRFERGSAMMLLVALLWSFTLLLDKRAIAWTSPYVHALVLNAGVALGGLAALIAWGRARELASIRPRLATLAIAVLIGAAALTLQLLALRSAPMGVIETTKRGVGGFSAVAVGAALYGEGLTARKVGAVLVMTLGVALILL